MRRPALTYAGLFVAAFLLVVVLRRLPVHPTPQTVEVTQPAGGGVLQQLAHSFATQPGSNATPAAESKPAATPAGPAKSPAAVRAAAQQDLTAGLSKIAVPDPKLSYDDSLRRRFRAEKLLQDANAATVPVDRVNALANLRDFAATQGDPGGEIVSLMRALVADDDPDVARTAKQITWQLTGGN
jgi:hypothetical protein